jgi:integrase
MLYFNGCLRPAERTTVRSEPHTQTRNGKRVSIRGYEYIKLASRDYRDLHDVAKLMLLQGPRPAEVMQARVEDIDLEGST